MIIQTIQQQVKQVLLQSAAGDSFDQRLDQLAQNSAAELTQESRAVLRQLAENYVTSSVWMLAEVDAVTTTLGLANVVAPALQTAAGYYLNDNDLIPDQSGLLGLLDDAYLATRFIAQLSELYRAQTGVALLDVSLDNTSQLVRTFIEPQLAHQLDTMTQQGLAQVSQNLALAQLQPLQYRTTADWNRWVDGQNRINAEAELMAITGGMF